MQDASNIGATAAIQNPEKALEAKEGTYQDNAANLTDQQRFPNLQVPSAPDPVPFTITGGGGGSR